MNLNYVILFCDNLFIVVGTPTPTVPAPPSTPSASCSEASNIKQRLEFTHNPHAKNASSLASGRKGICLLLLVLWSRSRSESAFFSGAGAGIKHSAPAPGCLQKMHICLKY